MNLIIFKKFIGVPAYAAVGISFLAIMLLAPPLRAQRLMVWGNDAFGQISEAPEGDIRYIAAGGATQGLAIREDRSPVLWGGNQDPFAIPSEIPDDFMTETRSACIGRTHAVLILQDGSVASWSLSQPLGDPNVPTGRFRAVSCGNRHTVGITQDGTLRAWGANDVHQLEVPPGHFKEVAVRVLYSIALRTDGALVGWGLSPSGPFNPGVFASWTPDPEDPVHYYLEGNYKAIAAGNNHALAIRTNGSVVGWGFNSGSANSGNPLAAPEHVRFKAIAAGFGFSVGIDTEGTLWGWGTVGSPPPPLPPASWTFESVGWTQYDEAGHYFVPGEKFRSVTAAAFSVNAITDDSDE